MKKLFAVLLVLTSTNAFATKARYKALNSSFHLVDTQSEFSSPYHIFSLPDFVSVESGLSTATTVDNNAEGLAKFSTGDNSKMLVAIGHKDEAIQSQRKFMNAASGKAFLMQQNPVEVIYGVKTGGNVYAGGLFYSKYKDKTTDKNEESTGARFGATFGDFKAKINLGLVNKVQNVVSPVSGDGTFSNQPYTNVAVRYAMGENKFGLDFTMWNAKRDDTLGVEANSFEFQNIKFQYVNTTAKDGEDFFYGVAVDSISLKDKTQSKDLRRLALPVWFGLEHQASEWLTVRGSLKQTLWAQSTDDRGYSAGAVDGASGVDGVASDFSPDANNTEAAIGVGLKYKSVMFDGTLSGLTGKTANQQLDGNNLLAQAGLTYNY